MFLALHAMPLFPRLKKKRLPSDMNDVTCDCFFLITSDHEVMSLCVYCYSSGLLYIVSQIKDNAF